MGDHWKSLAQKLGAPGMDDPTTSISESASTTETPAFTRESEPTKPVEPLAEIMTPAPEPEVVGEKPRKRSSWESLASMFNIQLDRTPAEPPAPAPTPVKPALEATPPRERESRPAAHREKPRFNEPRREREPERESEPRLQVFQESPDSDANPALESLFADVPRGDLDSWKRPPRVVDDIGWGEEVPVAPSKDVEPEFISEIFETDSEAAVEGSVESSDRPRRRRRRRGPRRPDDVTPRLDRDLDDVESIMPGDEYSEPESFEVELSDVDESPVAGDPERRSSRRRRRGRKRPSDDAAPTHPDDGVLNAELASERPGDRPERMPERAPRPERSGERPRSRSRSNEPSGDRGSDRSADRSADRGSERPERGPERGSERPARGSERGDRPERDPERAAERGSVRNERPARPERAPDSRREKRSERPESRADRPPRVREERPLPPRSDVEELDEVDILEDLDSEDSGEKHRNIPSWADALQAIIEGNMENHKRNDNRGGPPRGRPRSRR